MRACVRPSMRVRMHAAQRMADTGMVIIDALLRQNSRCATLHGSKRSWMANTLAHAPPCTGAGANAGDRIP